MRNASLQGTYDLKASAPVGELQIAGLTASVDFDRRIIEGIVVPHNGHEVPANTSIGPTTFARGALPIPSDLRRVKLLREHQQTDSVGYAVEMTQTDQLGLWAKFYVPEGPNGDRALIEASNGIRDGLSVGASSLTGERDAQGVARVTSGSIREVSLVSVPAWVDSRVTRVTATERQAMPCTICKKVHVNGVTTCKLDDLTAAGVLAVVAPTPPAAIPGPAAIATLTASELTDAIRTALSAGAVVPTPPLGGPNSVPGAPADKAKDGMSLSDFVKLTAANYMGNGNPIELRAALNDVTPSDAPSAFRPAYLDELWDGSPYVRKYIENATTQRPLPKTMKIVGQRWTTAPQVADYAGDKAAVPSGDAILADIEVAVARYAGAHDVDRAFIDLGSEEWLTSYFEAQTESAARLSDARAATAGWNGATALTVATPPTLLGGVVAAIVELATIGESAEYVAMAPGLIAELLGISQANAPAFFSGSFSLGSDGDGALGGLTWFTTPGLSGKRFIVGAKAAQRWHEMTPPIKVQALNIPNGGIDLGVFGYYATYTRNAAQARKGTVTPV